MIHPPWVMEMSLPVFLFRTHDYDPSSRPRILASRLLSQAAFPHYTLTGRGRTCTIFPLICGSAALKMI